MSDLREFPIGEDFERLSLLIGPCDVLAIHQARIADIERRQIELIQQEIDRLGNEGVHVHSK